jgi:hypothetical protein
LSEASPAKPKKKIREKMGSAWREARELIWEIGRAHV